MFNEKNTNFQFQLVHQNQIGYLNYICTTVYSKKKLPVLSNLLLFLLFSIITSRQIQQNR